MRPDDNHPALVRDQCNSDRADDSPLDWTTGQSCEHTHLADLDHDASTVNSRSSTGSVRSCGAPSPRARRRRPRRDRAPHRAAGPQCPELRVPAPRARRTSDHRCTAPRWRREPRAPCCRVRVAWPPSAAAAPAPGGGRWAAIGKAALVCRRHRGLERRTTANGRACFQRREFGGLSGAPRSRRACTVGRCWVVAATLNPPPDIDCACWQALAHQRA